MFRQNQGGATMKKVKDKQRADPIKSRKPEIPLTGAGMPCKMVQNIESLIEVPILSLSLRKFQLYFSPFTYLAITCYTLLFSCF